MATPDPLEGYRGRSRDEYEAFEDEIRAMQAAAEDDIDTELMGFVLKHDRMMADLKNETSTLRRLVTYATARLDEACKRWQCSADPADIASLNAHRDARAARLLLDWIQEQIELGKQAEHQLEVDEHG